MINLGKNERENRIKSILYMAISFDDMLAVQKLLHPKGEFLGMSKGRFMHYLMESKEFEKLGDSNEDGEEVMQESEYHFVMTKRFRWINTQEKDVFLFGKKGLIMDTLLRAFLKCISTRKIR